MKAAANRELSHGLSKVRELGELEASFRVPPAADARAPKHVGFMQR